jgi:hypothetical protein
MSGGKPVTFTKGHGQRICLQAYKRPDTAKNGNKTTGSKRKYPAKSLTQEEEEEKNLTIKEQ